MGSVTAKIHLAHWQTSAHTEVPKYISVDLHRCRIAKRLPDVTFYLILRREVDLFEQFRRDRDAACRLDLAKGRTFVHRVV